MKSLLILILLGGLGYLVYAQHDRIAALQTSLDQSTAQVTDLQAKLAAEKAKKAQTAAAPASNPLDSQPVGGASQPQFAAPSSSTLLDRGHKGPLDR